MSRQIEQALLSLMPTYGSELPPSLVELASSLLAQSRNAISTLKAEEEISRTYACANIACDRLKITLDLPPIKPRPPIPPRNYKKLYTHIDGALPNPSTPSRQRSTRTRTPGSRVKGSESRPLPSRATPTKEQSLSIFRTKNPTSRSSGNPSAGNVLPPWVQAVCRFICVETRQDHFAGSIIAGMDAIAAPMGVRTNDAWINQNLAPLLGAVYFYVTIRAVAIETGQEMTKEPFAAQRREVLKFLSRAREEVTVTVTGDQDPWEDWEEAKTRDFNSAVTQIEEQGWLDSDWFKGLDDVVGKKDWNNTDIPRIAGKEEEEEEAALSTNNRRADTMFNEKYDYLSEARQADYEVWKQKILNRISEMQAAETAMDIDTHE